MAEPFIGQIITVGFNFAPRGYALCNGQIMSIAQNSALFSLLGTMYGGDGIQTFGLPDLRGRVALHFGQGPGLSNYTQGERAGEENHTLIVGEIPAHNHLVNANTANGTIKSPANNYLAQDSSSPYLNTANTTMNPGVIAPTGGNQPHNNRQPYLVINFCIALEGIFPSRN
ncbi:MAG: phage tail protein [Acidobacteria bacterium]|nr:phage tail protein [Acidobacteriota bacterium]